MTGERKREAEAMRFKGSVLVMCVLAGAAGATTIGTAAAAPAGGPFHFETPTPVLDTQISGSKIPAGTDFYSTPGVYNVIVLEPQADGVVTVGPCGGPPTHIAIHYEAGRYVRNRVLLSGGECLTTSASIHVVVYRSATFGPVDEDGFGYFPLGEPVVVLDTYASADPLGTAARQIDLPAQVPVHADGVAVVVSGVSDGNASITVQDCGTGFPFYTDLLVEQDEVANVVHVDLRATGEFCVAPAVPPGTTTDLVVQVLGYFTDEVLSTALPPTYVFEEIDPPGLVPRAPVRVLDTRGGPKVAAGQVLSLHLDPWITDGTTAVVVNATVTQPEAAGYLTVFPCDDGLPDSSNLNFPADRDVANLVTTAVSIDGTICLFSSADTHVLVDLAGTYDLGSGDPFHPIDPQRVHDTRGGTKLAAGQVLPVVLTGHHGIPSGASAATFNLTATQPEGDGYLTAYPCDVERPVVSNVNFDAGRDVPNQVTVKLAGDGSVCIVSSVATHVIVDTAGYYRPGPGGAGLVAYVPGRVLDTRQDPTPLAPGEIVAIPFASEVLDDPSTTAVVLNLTATRTTAAGYALAYPCEQQAPSVSSLNYGAGRDVANHATVKLDADGWACFETDHTIDLLVDVTAAFTTGPLWFPVLREG